MGLLMRLANKLKTEYEKLLKTKGEEYFYKYAIGIGFMEGMGKEYPEILVLDRSDAFFSLFRQTGNENFFIIGKLLRRAAHRLYRNRIKDIKKPENNPRFLHLVK